MWLQLAQLCLLIPPLPPSDMAGRVVYGREAGLLKGSDDARLLDPPIVTSDPLFELRNVDHPSTLPHIEAENAFADAMLQRSAPCARALLGLLGQTANQTSPHASGGPVWYRGADRAGWEYALRTDGAHGAYPRLVRRRALTTPGTGADDDAERHEQLVLDANAAAALLPSAFQSGVTYLGTVRGVSALVPSPWGGRIAYTVDATGNERFSLMIADVDPASGAAGSPIDTAAGVDADVCWGASEREVS